MPRVADPVVRYPEKDSYWRQRIYWMVLWELTGTARGQESKPSRKVNALEGGEMVKAGGWAGSLDGEVLWFETGVLVFQAPHLKTKKWSELAHAGGKSGKLHKMTLNPTASKFIRRQLLL